MNPTQLLTRSAAALLLACTALSAAAQHHGGHRGGGGPGWHRGGYSHGYYGPRPGWGVRVLPPLAAVVLLGGVSYRYWDGYWYAPGPRGYLTVSPPYGAVIGELPAPYSVVSIGGVSYILANGVYYRAYPAGGYEVVAPPVDGNSAQAVPSQPAQLLAGKPYVYPARAQSAEQQATDEYECHAWAVSQSGFDPTTAATGQRANSDPAQRGNYQRARVACLEGRGYTVR